eukprot:TRINITY_DN1908_c0_g1_i2.p1 TRINITY_DN1908_c0_g1~~TRINITY_DN1908_c0_g1_i2.p1  ORF type:complete len:183 (-),score=41.20 TRINITY_DN1908_c0_g1_i2:655-1137(-)
MNRDLLSKLDAKDKELQRLKVDISSSTDSSHAHVVELAKKNRTLTVLVEKEKTKTAKLSVDLMLAKKVAFSCHAWPVLSDVVKKSPSRYALHACCGYLLLQAFLGAATCRRRNVETASERNGSSSARGRATATLTCHSATRERKRARPIGLGSCGQGFSR